MWLEGTTMEGLRLVELANIGGEVYYALYYGLEYLSIVTINQALEDYNRYGV
jgi:hypothetical protein